MNGLEKTSIIAFNKRNSNALDFEEKVKFQIMVPIEIQNYFFIYHNKILFNIVVKEILRKVQFIISQNITQIIKNLEVVNLNWSLAPKVVRPTKPDFLVRNYESVILKKITKL